MKKLSIVLLVFLLGSMVLLSGCSTTKLVQTWRDTSFPDGQLNNPLVVAMAQQGEMRVRIEEGFVRRLKDHGVNATQSYTRFPEKSLPDADVLRKKVTEMQNDSLLQLRLIDVEQGTIRSSGSLNASASTTSPNFSDLANRGASSDSRELAETNQDFGSYYVSNTRATSTASHRGYTYEYTLYTLEMNLYAAQGEKLIWSAVVETEIGRNSDAALEGLVAVGLKNMQNAKLFAHR